MALVVLVMFNIRYIVWLVCSENTSVELFILFFGSVLRNWPNARFPPFRCGSSVAISPFYRCKSPLFCKNYVRKFRSVTAVNSKKSPSYQRRRAKAYVNCNGVRKRRNGKQERQQNGGNRA